MLIYNVEIHRIFSSFLFGQQCRYPRYLRPRSGRSTLQRLYSHSSAQGSVWCFISESRLRIVRVVCTSIANGSALWGRVGQRPPLLFSCPLTWLAMKGIRQLKRQYPERFQLNCQRKDGKCHSGQIPLDNPRYVAALQKLFCPPGEPVS